MTGKQKVAALFVILSALAVTAAYFLGISYMEEGTLLNYTSGTSSMAFLPVSPDSENSSESSGNSIRPVDGIVLNQSNLKLKKGDSVTLKAATHMGKDISRTVAWFSSNKKVASVNSKGQITAVEGGTASVTAKSMDGKTAECKVSVVVPATKISLNLSDLVLEAGEARTLSVKIRPSDFTDKVKWSSSDNKIVKVSGNGRIQAVSDGTASVTASVGKLAASCRIRVGIDEPELRLQSEQISLQKGNTYQLTATSGNHRVSASWLSSNASVASVDETGKITARSAGEAVITAIDGKYSAQCAVKVTVPISRISLNKRKLILEPGTGEALTAEIVPDDATDRTVSWTSTNKDVASVDEKGKVKALKTGRTTIMVKSGPFSDRCDVEVVVSVLTITMDPDKLTLEKGSSQKISAIVTPFDTTEDKSIAWVSSDPSVASVDGFGNVTAWGGGTARVTAKTAGGRFWASCLVTVTVPVDGISLNRTSLSLTTGKSETLISLVTPSDATIKDVFWDSSSSKIAAVDQFGKITAVSPGTAVVAATTKDGSFTASCQITVLPEEKLSAVSAPPAGLDKSAAELDDQLK